MGIFLIKMRIPIFIIVLILIIIAQAFFVLSKENKEIRKELKEFKEYQLSRNKKFEDNNSFLRVKYYDLERKLDR